MTMRRRLIPDIANLQAFESAARHGNFTRAAAELNLTQSAVSRQIRDLEQQTGLLLFERVRQRVVLSEAGARFLPDVRKLLGQSEKLMIGAMAAEHMRQSLHIATLPTFGARWLVPRLGGFMALSDVAVTIESRSQPFVFEEENFDLAIHYGQPVWPRATCTFLCNETVLPVVKRAVAERWALEDPSGLSTIPLIHLTTRPRLWSDWFDAHAVVTDNAYRGLRLDQFSMIIAAAVAGLGAALLPSYLIEEELRSGILVSLFDLPMATDNSYYIAVPEEKRQNATARNFVEWLTAQVGSDAFAQSETRG